MIKTKSLIWAPRPYLAWPCLPSSPYLVSHSGSLLRSWTAPHSPHPEPLILFSFIRMFFLLIPSHPLLLSSVNFYLFFGSVIGCYRNGRNHTSCPVWVFLELCLSPIKRKNLLPLPLKLGWALWLPWEQLVAETTPWYSVCVALSLSDAEA